MTTVYALLAAINNYPNPQHRLNGCLNDLDGMLALLEDYCQNHKLTLKAVVLKDKEATRANIIQGFEHLALAGEGDHCLFFFAGHGSRCRAPQGFWHLAPDKMNESLVCWDSRTQSGRDLIDKELSYLIWKVTHGKDISFLSITDCCHSGSNMRLEPVGERRMNKVNTAIPIEQYLGFEHYERVGEGQYTPPLGRYIHLAACQPHETAKEVKVKGQKRGIFSYLLQDVLVGSRSPLSYAELLARARARVRHYMKDQYPMLETSHSGDQNRFFLSNQEQEATAPYLVSHHKTKGWMVNAGSLHNMIAGSGSVKTEFELLEDGRKIELVQVFADYSTVSGMEGANAGEAHPARLVSQVHPRLPLSPAANSDSEGMKIFEELLQAQPFSSLEWVDSPEEARFLVHAKSGSYYLTSPQDERPLFKRVEGFYTETAKDFLDKLNTVARWIRLQELGHSNSRIPLSNIEISLCKGTDPGNLEDDAPAKAVDWREPGLFSYEYSNGKAAMPTFKLRITNNSDTPLWANVLYLGADYSVSNILMPMEHLRPGAEAWCSYLRNMHTNRVIPVMLNDTFHQWGLTRSFNYLKVILCTAEFDTNGFNQEGLELERYREEEQDRNLGFEENVSKEDWAILTIPLTIYRPLDTQPLNALNAASFFGHHIQSPQGFAAGLRLATLEDACRTLPFFPELEIAPGAFLYPAELGPPESHPQLSVLELHDCKGANTVSTQRPLQVQVREDGGSALPFAIYGLDKKNAYFYPLRSRWEGRSLFIEELPEGEEGVVRIFCFNRH